LCDIWGRYFDPTNLNSSRNKFRVIIDPISIDAYIASQLWKSKLQPTRDRVQTKPSLTLSYILDLKQFTPVNRVRPLQVVTSHTLVVMENDIVHLRHFVHSDALEVASRLVASMSPRLISLMCSQLVFVIAVWIARRVCGRPRVTHNNCQGWDFHRPPRL
jgi:hypothetical protein